jgi:hypothetical protein
MMIAGAAASCRSHWPLCRGVACHAPQAAGAGPAEAAAGEAGQAVPAPACSSDAECSNALACDGQERCSEDGCQPGDPVACPYPALHCEEDASEPCVFDTPSPWLVIARGETLEGLPTSELGKQKLIPLASRPPSRGLGYAGTLVAAGPFAVPVALEEEFLYRAQYLRFGRGLPSKLQLLPDVPDLIDSLDAPLLSPDSRYVLVIDDATGMYMAPLEDRRQATYFFPREEGSVYQAGFCEDSRTFWRRDQAGLSVVTLTDEATSSRLLEASGTPLWSWQKRFLVLETTEPTGVLVTPCTADGESTFYDGAYEPVIGPGSETLLLSFEAGGQTLYSLDPPDAKRELWSNGSVRIESATFSPDGAHVVGWVEDQLCVADLNDAGQRPAALGVPSSASLASAKESENGEYMNLVGNTAALIWVPTEDGEGRELYWQPLAPSLKPQSLFSDPRADSVNVRISQHDVNQAFIVLRDGELYLLKRLRLDTEKPEVEDLFALDSDINRVELAPDGSGLAVLALSEPLQSNVYWAAFEADGKADRPALVSDDSYSFSFQALP